jgi:hypothetical protein
MHAFYTQQKCSGTCRLAALMDISWECSIRKFKRQKWREERSNVGFEVLAPAVV